MSALIDVTLDRNARDFRRSLDALYYRIRELKRQQPQRSLISARREEGTKVRIVVLAATSRAASAKRPGRNTNQVSVWRP